MEYLAAWLIGLGMVAIGASIVRTQHLIGILRDKRPWPSLRNLMAFFAVSYGVYLYAILSGIPLNKDLITGEVFFLSALFMLLVVQYAYQTIHDILHLDEFKHLANTDALTGMYSRRAILELLEDEFQKAQRFGFPLSVAMIDIDHFKKVNDTLSHLAGDVVLKELGALLKTESRAIDTVGRFGGEEFVIIAPNRKKYHAVRFAERLRKAIEDHVFSYKGARIRLTISAGIASLFEGRDYTVALERADKALYHAKRHGRNRTGLWRDGKLAIASEHEG